MRRTSQVETTSTVRRILVGSLAIGLALRALTLPEPLAANPAAAAVVRYVAVFLAEYAAGAILDEILLDSPPARRADPRFVEMRNRYDGLHQNLSELRGVVESNNRQIRELRSSVEAIERRAALHDQLFREATEALREVRIKLSQRDQEIEQLLADLPSRVEAILDRRDRSGAGRLADELQGLIPRIERAEPLSTFLEELTIFARKTTATLDDLRREIDVQSAQVADMRRTDQIIIAELAAIRGAMDRSHRPHSGEALRVSKDYTSVTGIGVFLGIQEAISRSCEGVIVVGSDPYPGESITLRQSLSYEIDCFDRGLEGESFRECRLEYEVAPSDSPVGLRKVESVFGKDWSAIDVNLGNLVAKVVEEQVCPAFH